jgi:hypothetical protein
MRSYQVTAVVVTREGSWDAVKQVPTFVLHDMVDEQHATRVARSIIDPLEDPDVQVCVCAVAI